MPHYLIFITDNAAYWDSNANKMVTMFRIAKAAATGDKPTHVGKHGELNI